MPLFTSNPPQQCRWNSFNTTAELEQAATQAILQADLKAASLCGTFQSFWPAAQPHHVYASLRNADADWAAWHVYFVVERCLPADHEERNSWMATKAWMNHVAIPLTHIHLIPAEKDLQAAASAYAQTLAGIMKTKFFE